MRFLFQCEQMALFQAFAFQNFLPNIENGMHREAATARRRVNHSFVSRWIKHSHTHVNHITRCEILSFFAFAAFVYQIFESLVHHIKVGIEQFHILQGTHTNRQMRRCQHQFGIFGENARPLFLCLIEKVLQLFFQFSFCVAVVAEL